MRKLARLGVALVLGVGLLCFAGYEAFMHSDLDVSILSLAHEIIARTPVQLIGLSSTNTPPEDEQEWKSRSTDERSRLVATWIHALEVAVYAQSLERRRMPATSLGLDGVSAESRLDGWGRPFCLAATRNRLAVVSAGLSGDPMPSCQINLDNDELRGLPDKKLHVLTSGYVVLFSN